MGVILPYLTKDVDQTAEDQSGFNFPEYSNATGDSGPFGFIGSGVDLINNIINQATGTTAQQLANQRAQADALAAQARAMEARKNTGIKIAIIIGISAVAITGTIMGFRYYKRKRVKVA